MFKKYPKIYRLGKEENDGILDDNVFVQEKIDGANVSIWLENGEVKCASRNREITEGFNGFVDYVKENKNIINLLKENPTLRLYGEWLVRHTISYNETAYKHFYLFDILDDSTNKWFTINEVDAVAKERDIKHAEIFFYGKVDNEKIEKYVGKSKLGEVGEGVVIKNPEFVNKFGDLVYAKVVTEKFKETNALVFGGNNKHSETYWEMYIVNKYATIARVEKVMNKLQPEIDKRLDKEHTPRIAGTCYHDMITEEAWEIAKKVQTVNFKKLKRLATRKFIQIYHDVLDNNLSVADKNV